MSPLVQVATQSETHHRQTMMTERAGGDPNFAEATSKQKLLPPTAPIVAQELDSSVM